jgi:2-haloacid dehalogenase
MTRPQVVVFDVNETLLDMSKLRPAFAQVFGSAEPMGEWFVRMLHGSLVADHVGAHRPFDLIGAEALVVLGQRRGVGLTPDDAARMVAGMRTLPPHPEVPAALERLAAAGVRVAALSNNPADTLTDQLGWFAFERVISVDAVGRFKPAPEVYLHAAVMLGVDVDQAMLVAAHDWDVVGARSIGMPGAFVARPGVVWGLPDKPPAIVAPDLTGIVGAILDSSPR